MPTDKNKIIGEMFANSIAGEVSKPVNKFVGADVSMSDNKRGGVDLKVDGITRTLANERDLLSLIQTVSTKQPILINGRNIKTINGIDILGSGDIAIDAGMKFYKAEYDGAHITHDGNILTYAQIVDKYNDPNYFIYIEHDGYIFIPSLPPLEGDEIVEFICTYVYGGDVVVSRIIINSEEQTKYEHINIAKKDDISYSAIAERLYNNTTNLTDAQKLRIEAWLGLSENYLTYYNATPYQVNGDYVPAHKKFVETYVAEHGTGYDDTEIRKEIEDIKYGYDIRNYINNFSMDEDGEIIADSGYVVSDFIEIPDGVTTVVWYAGQNGPDGRRVLCEYNSDKQVTDYWNSNRYVRTLELTPGTKYIRATFNKGKFSDGYNKITLEDGTVLYEVSDTIHTGGLEDVKADLASTKADLNELSASVSDLSKVKIVAYSESNISFTANEVKTRTVQTLSGYTIAGVVCGCSTTNVIGYYSPISTTTAKNRCTFRNMSNSAIDGTVLSYVVIYIKD